MMVVVVVIGNKIETSLVSSEFHKQKTKNKDAHTKDLNSTRTETSSDNAKTWYVNVLIYYLFFSFL